MGIKINDIEMDLNPSIPALKGMQDKTEVDIRYPLISPFAFAHIYWDSEHGELIYDVEEPPLDERETSILYELEEAMRDIINVDVVHEKDIQSLVEYTDKTARLLISELSISLNDESYNKIFYYLFRDFVGLNKIEAIMKDYFIEDIECNGIDTPVYIVHRIYRNIKTNIIYHDVEELASFVEKLAQKSGRYISYANPLLDATLPDGSRINATYTKDITSRGPTFTVRKFTKVPWTPIKLLSFNTLSPEMLAYFWLLVEYRSNILISGGTGSGKCVSGDTPVYLSDGEIVRIKDLVEDKIKDNKVKADDGWEYVNGDGTEILSMNNNLKIDKAKVDRFWRHKAPDKLYKIKTKSGREVTTTPEHPFFILRDGKVIKINAEKLFLGERVAVPKRLPLFNKKVDIDFIAMLKNEPGVYVPGIQDEIKRLNILIMKKNKFSHKKEICQIIGCKLRTFYEWENNNAVPLGIYYKLLELSGEKRIERLKLKGDTSGNLTSIPELQPSLFRFLGLVIGDGHLRKGYVELHNSDDNLLNEFIELGQELFGVKGIIKDYKYRVKRVRLYSPIVAKLLNIAFQVPFGNKARKVIVPEILFKQNNECVKEFISAIFDCEGYVGKNQLEIGMSSKKILDGLSTLLLRFGIVPRLSERRVVISSKDNVQKFKDNFILRSRAKDDRLKSYLKQKTNHTNVDLVPNCANLFLEARTELGLNKAEFARMVGVSRRLIGMWESGDRLPSTQMFSKFASCVSDLPNPGREIVKLANSEIFWDEVLEIKLKENKENYVYDLTVENHNFLAGNVPMIVHNTTLLNAIAFFIPPEARVISIEDTREIELLRENWLPAVARTPISTGQTAGEIDMFSLLKNSFRQNPDYVIVGEVRGKEAFVLFQGMASGHASMSTIHADSVQGVIRRLETPPIELSPSLLETLDAVVIMAHAVVEKKQTRRLREVVEIIEVPESGEIKINTPFVWNPAGDNFYFKNESHVLRKISQKYGLKYDDLVKEFGARTKLIYQLYKKGVFGFEDVQRIILDYYKDPMQVLKKYGVV